MCVCERNIQQYICVCVKKLQVGVKKSCEQPIYPPIPFSFYPFSLFSFVFCYLSHHDPFLPYPFTIIPFQIIFTTLYSFPFSFLIHPSTPMSSCLLQLFLSHPSLQFIFTSRSFTLSAIPCASFLYHFLSFLLLDYPFFLLPFPFLQFPFPFLICPSIPIPLPLVYISSTYPYPFLKKIFLHHPALIFTFFMDPIYYDHLWITKKFK